MEDPHPYINSGVYVLLLEGDKFYVGYSEDIESRLSGKHGAKWTEKYTPLKIHDKFPAKSDFKKLEREVTLMYMERYGWENVRGAGWTRKNMKNPPMELRN